MCTWHEWHYSSRSSHMLLPCNGESKNSRTASRQQDFVLCFDPMVHGVTHGWRHILHFRDVRTECIPAASSHSRSSVLLAAATVRSTDPPAVWTSTHITVRASWPKPVDDSQKARSQHQYSKMKVLFATLDVSITSHSVKLLQPQLTFGELMRPLVNNALCWARRTVRPVSQW